MATDVVKTIATSGGDYTTVAAWESAQQGNLVSLDERHIGEITGTVTDSNQIVINGSTTDSTRYMMIRAASSEEFNGNPAGTFATLSCTYTGGGESFYVQDPYFRYQSLKITATGSKSVCVAQEANITIEKCWLYSSGSSGTAVYTGNSSATDLVLIATLISGWSTSVQNPQAVTTDPLFINCILSTRPDAHNNGLTAYNTYAVDFYSSGSGTYAGDYNAADNTSSPGANSIDNITDTDEFQDPANDDYRIKTSSQLLEAGTDKSAYLTTDVEGETITTWMIGFDYEVYVSASTDVSATTDSLSITDYAASITQPINVSATTDSLAITDLAATVQADVDSNITATVDTLTITDYAASISLGKNIAATADSLTITDFAASVQADVDTNITTTTDSLSITDFAASVQADIDSNISASIEALSITDYAATVQADVDTNVTATADSLSITDFDTAVSTNTITRVNATTDNLSITDHDAQVEELVASLTAYQSATFYISNGIPQRIFN